MVKLCGVVTATLILVFAVFAVADIFQIPAEGRLFPQWIVGLCEYREVEHGDRSHCVSLGCIRDARTWR